MPNVELEVALIGLQARLQAEGVPYDAELMEAHLCEDHASILLLHPCGDNWVGASFALPGVVEFPHCFYPEQ